MNRITLLASALTLVVVVGGLALVSSRDRGVSPPAATASPSPASPRPSFETAPLPDTLRANWAADVTAIDGLGNTDPRIRLAVANDGGLLQVQTNEFGNTTLRSLSQPAPDGEIRLVIETDGVGCATGDQGSYRWTESADGLALSLEVISDTCATRAETLARTWTRTIDVANRGGRGLVSIFEPGFLVTLPPGAYRADTMPDAAEITSGSNGPGLVAVRDPYGLKQPCGLDGSRKQPVEPTAAAFVAYLRTLPGFAVETTDLEIDGRSAVHATIVTEPTADCPGGEVGMWVPKTFENQTVWGIPQGGSGSGYLVEVDGHLYLLQWTGSGVTPDDELSVLSTIQFLDALPTAP